MALSSYQISGEPWTEKPLIFVVEDDADIERLICHHLNASGYATRRFASSASMLEEAKKAFPFAVLAGHHDSGE